MTTTVESATTPESSTRRANARLGAPAAEPAPVAASEEFPDFRRLLDGYAPIGLAEMDGVALLNRTDTKYLLTTEQLLVALISLPSHYRVLRAAGTRLSRYRTIYFDTESFDLYLDHHSGRPFRYKLRSRQYVDSGLSFLEVKGKGKRERTVKKRIRTAGLAAEWPAEAARSILPRELLDGRWFEAKLESEFRRITLVSREQPERVTLDLGLSYSAGERSFAIPNLVIAEVKQDGINRDSAVIQELRAAGIRPASFSKYCVGVALLYPCVKHNCFKPQLRLIKRLIERLDGGANHA